MKNKDQDTSIFKFGDEDIKKIKSINFDNLFQNMNSTIETNDSIAEVEKAILSTENDYVVKSDNNLLIYLSAMFWLLFSLLIASFVYLVLSPFISFWLFSDQISVQITYLSISGTTSIATILTIASKLFNGIKFSQDQSKMQIRSNKNKELNKNSKKH